VFQRPSRLGDKVRFTLRVERVGGSSVKMGIEGQGPEGLRLKVGMTLAWIDRMKAAPWPAEMRAALESYKEKQDA
jgi:4-hydroxybenzoyl-CoA thioesterase